MDFNTDDVTNYKTPIFRSPLRPKLILGVDRGAASALIFTLTLLAVLLQSIIVTIILTVVGLVFFRIMRTATKRDPFFFKIILAYVLFSRDKYRP